MEVIYSKRFEKDLKKIKDKNIRLKLKSLIIKLKSAETLYEIEGVKKIKSTSTAYRVKIDNYRLGIYLSGGAAGISRFLKRNDIYKVFPKKNT